MHPQFEDRGTLDALLDNLFNSFDCDESGARGCCLMAGEMDGQAGRHCRMTVIRAKDLGVGNGVATSQA